MQKLLKDYLDDFNKKQKKNRRAAVAAVLLVVMVVGSVLNILTQYGVAMTGAPVCGQEEHVHGESCYASVLSCGQEETEGLERFQNLPGDEGALSGPAALFSETLSKGRGSCEAGV